MAEAFGVAASALAVVELSASVVKICAKYTKDVANARQDMEKLQKEVKSLGSIAESVRDLSENSSQHKVTTIKRAQPSLDEGRTRLAELQTKLDPGKREKYMSRIGFRAIKWPFSSRDVEKALTDLARLTHAISLAISVDQTTVLLSLEQKTALAKLPIAEGAAYDSHADEHNPQCLEETRTEVLREIAEWVRDPSSESKAVYWLNGMAGTGKSTISRTIANRFSKKDDPGVCLGATFFFKRSEGDRSRMSKFFTTITSQLVQQLPEIADHVQAAIETDPALISKAMRIQFETLILDPVAKIPSIDPTRRIFLFVIDALDECERERDVQLLIELLSGIPRTMDVQLRFFLTSRPELPIRLGFNSVDGKYQDFILHEVAEPIIEHDLQVYLRHELERARLTSNQGIPEERKLSTNWPIPTDLGSLVQMAIPLFIFAATICRFIADRKGGNPEKKLQRVLEFRSAQGSKLVATYMPVLEQLILDLAPKEQSDVLLQFQRIIGAIVVLADPLGSKPLSRLLAVEINEISELLDFLHSVLQVPLSVEQPIRLLHQSFRDFLIDPARQESLFWIDKKQVHQKLAEQCLRVLNTSLKNDICHVKAPETFATSISASSIRTNIPPELQYACRFWTHHLRESSSPDLYTTNIWEFLRSHFLQWLEALSWMGRLPESFGIVTDLQSTSHIERDHEMTEFLKDLVRFLQAANSSIQIAPLQAYSSSLAFAPSQSIIRRIYEGDMADYIAQGPRMSPFWDDRLQTFEVYSHSIVQIAFLSDGKLLGVAFADGTVIVLAADTGEHRLRVQGRKNSPCFSAFSPDGKLLALVTTPSTVTLWHTETGEVQQTFDGQRNTVRGVVFSSDSKFLASVSRDGSVMLWVVDTGKLQRRLGTPSKSVYSASFKPNTIWSIAISPDNKLLALKLLDPTIILWETETGKCRKILKGHSNRITSIEFSSDSNLLSSSSEDQTIILWDTEKIKQQRILKAHSDTVNAVAFSPDDNLLASASDDGTVVLWHNQTGQQRQSLRGHNSRVHSVTFSPDGKLLASASRGGTVILWAAESGTLLRTFEAGVNQSNYISFSPDSKRLAATSGRESISVWATDMTECGQMPEKHSKSIKVMKFSPDNKLLASAGADGRVILWRPDTGEHTQALEGHTLWVNAVNFSPDSRFLASASGDQTAVLWVVDTGKRWQTLRGHTDSVHEVVFSPDGKILATISHDQTIALWNVDTGARRHSLEEHVSGITSIAFSPSGKILASASYDRSVILWAAETGECQQVIEYHVDVLSDLVFSSDNKLMGTVPRGTVVLRKAETEKGWQMPLEVGQNGSNMDIDQSAPSITIVQRSPGSEPPPGSYGTGLNEGGITQNQCWICLNGEPIMWLPKAYRPRQLAVSGHTIAIGCQSGRVLFLRLKSPFVIRNSVEIGTDDEACVSSSTSHTS